MINFNSFTNKNEITRKDFDELVKVGNLEVYTQDSLQRYVESVASMIEKGEEGGELTTEEKDNIEIAKAEIGNLQKVIVVDTFGGQIVKVPLYIQEPMIDIEKGVYHDNPLNRKLGRVGKQWGGKMEEGKEKPIHLDKNHKDYNSPESAKKRQQEGYDAYVTKKEKPAENKDEDSKSGYDTYTDDEKKIVKQAIKNIERIKGKEHSISIPELNNEIDKINKEKEDNKSEDHKVGDTVKIPSNLTTDPIGKQGETGEVTGVTKDYVTVKFKDGKVGRYDHDALQKVDKMKDSDFQEKRLLEQKRAFMAANSDKKKKD